MNQNNTRLYGILVDISGSMKQCYQQIQNGLVQENQIQQSDKTRLYSFWEIIQAAFQRNHLKNDNIFLSAFGCHHEVDVIDLVPFLKSVIKILKLISQIRGVQNQNQNNQTDYWQLLYQFVSNNGAINLSKFYTLEKLKTDISNFKAQLLYHQFKDNKKYLETFIEQLPKQVKKKKKTYAFQAILGQSFKYNGYFQNPIADEIQKQIRHQLNNLDNYIEFDQIFEKIRLCLVSTLQEVEKLKSQNNKLLEEELKKIIEELRNTSIPKNLKQLEKILSQITYIQDDIISFLHNYSFIPQDLIKEQTNLQKFQISSIEDLKVQMQIGQDRSEFLMKKDDLDLFKQFGSISYGGTPLIKCLKLTLNSEFQQYQNKFLFIVSDGDSTDGNPIEYANKLKEQGFTIFCYYITSCKKIEQNQLYSKIEHVKGDGAKTMFEMSSEYSNFEFPLRQIETYTNFKLSDEGKSRLFLQSNDSQQLKQFFEYFIQISKNFDLLIESIGRITIEKYINSSKKFEPQEQIGGTCYANSIAAAYSIMMSKIYKREGGYPGFFKIRDLLIQQYGTNGAKTFEVIQNTCSDFRLQCRRLESIHQIKSALHKRRPIIARFALNNDQWNSDREDHIGFKSFFQRNPLGILNILPQSDNNVTGHSVVLYSYTPDSYLFINSWGTGFGDKGYFRVKDLDVLGEMEFMEVFWNSSDLTESEKQAFKEDSGQQITKFYQQYLREIGDIKYTCPQCSQQSSINQYKGDYYLAICPRCNQGFQPKSLGQLFEDYLSGKNI